MSVKKSILHIKSKLDLIHPLPWTATGNYPFDVQIKKPRESLSKHTNRNPESWHCDDANYLLLCVNEMPKILEYIEKLEVKLARQREEFNKRREQDEYINDKVFSDLWDENEKLKQELEDYKHEA